MVSRVTEVNRLLRERGEEPRLRRGRGYFYFDGPALSWPASSVFVYRSDDLTVDGWIAEYERLKGEACE